MVEINIERENPKQFPPAKTRNATPETSRLLPESNAMMILHKIIFASFFNSLSMMSAVFVN